MLKEKLKLGVLFGGMSTENKVSIASAGSVLQNLDTKKYDIYPIYIDIYGVWYQCEEPYKNYKMNQELSSIKKIKNIIEFVRSLDVVFPVLHGLYGEDGTIQGLLEMIKIPYVGCKVLASSIAMDKVYSKIVFEKAGLHQAKYQYVKRMQGQYALINDEFEEELLSLNEIAEKIIEKIKFPMFIKPSNSGSSVGINKAKDKKELIYAIIQAADYDEKILIEEGIVGKEVECAVLGNKDITASKVGEIISAESFYSFSAKYEKKESKTLIPANISESISEEIRKQAIRAFKAIDGSGLSRVDFFVEKDTERIYINEINTLPGFTNISMYPKLFEASGISYQELLNNLIDLARC